MPEEIARSGRGRWVISLLVAVMLGFGGGVIFAQAGGGAWFNKCLTAAVPAAGIPVPAGAVVVPGGGPAPAGLVCTAGDTCTAPGAACGFLKRGTCTDTFVTRTTWCSCECV